MDFIKLKVLFQSLVLLVTYANIAGVNSLKLNLNNLSTARPSSNSQTVNSVSSSKAPTNEYVAAPETTQTELNSMANAASYGGKLLVDTKDADASLPLQSNSANLTEARITSITFRSEDGDVDASGIDKENTETISFGIRSFTVEVAAPATENPIPLNDDISSAVNENPLPEQVLSSVPISTYDDKLLSERIKVFQPSAILTPDFEHQQQQETNSAKLSEQGNGQSNMENQVKTSANDGNDDVNENDNGLNASGITIVPVKLTPNTQSEMVGSSTPTSAPIIINNNNEHEHEQLSISSNGMHVEQKLENGLYRIKIAEIITDAFNNGHGNDNGIKLNADDAIQKEHEINKNDNLNMRPPIPLSRFHFERTSSTGSGNNDDKINIADLYPSKLEDFTSIIRESNEKLINEKNRLVGLEKGDGDDDSSHVHDALDNSRFNIIDDQNEQEHAIRFSGGGIIGSDKGELGVNNDKQQTQINGPINSIENNIPTTKIEIELIDEPGTSKDVKIIGPSDDDDDDDYVNPIERTNTNDKVTDFTSKLQVNDELISEIEQSFRDTSMTNSLQQPMIPKPITINKPVNPMGFIERRTKKFDPAYKKRLMENREKPNDEQVKRITGPADIDSIAENTISSSNNKRKDGTKYLATKFYDVKDLVLEHDGIDSKKAVNSSEINQINGTVQHKHGINSPRKDTMGRQPIDANNQKILFINVNNNKNQRNNNSDKIDQTEIDRIQKHRQQIIKDSQRTVNATESMAPGEQQHQQLPSKNMHLYIIYDNADGTSNGRKSSESIQTNYKDSNNEQLAVPKAHSITTTDETTAMPLFLATRTTETVVSMKTTSNILSTQTSMHAISSTERNLEKHSSSINTISETTTERRTVAPPLETLAATTTTTSTTTTVPITNKPSHQSHSITDYYQKQRRLYDGILLEADCDMQTPIPSDSTTWRGNETHELNLPTTTPERCSDGGDCMPMIISWEGTAEIQSGDVLIVEVDDTLLLPADQSPSTANNIPDNGHRPTTAVYQVTRPGHEHCDATEGILLDITPLIVDGKKLVTLYDKDLTEGVNLLIVVSDLWGPQCVRLKVTVKSDNCGENAQCSEKGICFSNPTMEGYECQCCTGFAGSHCEEIDACSPSPCTNNGICVDLSQGHDGNSYQCLCPYGYSGKNCQFESDPCQNGECQNGGTCTGNATHFRCECAPGFTGPLCQHNLNECESSPCVHGICVDQEDGFRCFCQPGFSGELCNFEYNECDSNPCLNNGECTDHIGGFSCKCTRGFTGKRCHLKVDFCANNPCPEGHECHDHGNDFSCECPEGRAGLDCSQFPKTKCNVNPCANGGTCWRSVESFYCACRAGFTGRMCEDEFILDAVVNTNEVLTETDSATTHARPFGDSSFNAVVAKGTTFGLHNVYIAIGTFAAAIFIVSTVLCVCHCQYHKSYRHFKNKHKKLIPFFGFEFGLSRRNKKQLKHPKHWLSGKGNLSSANKMASTTALNQSNLNNSNGIHSANGTTEQQHRPQQLPNVPRFQRHLAMNLENDMYYTVDFSDSQHSPLIH